MKKIFQRRKVFDCQDMPDDLREVYFKLHHDCMIYTFNGSYLSWAIHDEIFDDEESEHAVTKKRVDAWLIENGAKGPKTDDDEGETVLIHYWW